MDMNEYEGGLMIEYFDYTSERVLRALWKKVPMNDDVGSSGGRAGDGRRALDQFFFSDADSTYEGIK